MWGQVAEDVGAAREIELQTDERFFKPVMDKEGKMLRHYNTTESAHSILRTLLANHPLPLQIQQELVTEKKDLSQTAAGAELSSEMLEQIRRHRAEVESIRQEMKGLFLASFVVHDRSFHIYRSTAGQRYGNKKGVGS